MGTKICHMTTVHSPYDTRIYWKECISLVKAGYDVSLIQRGSSGGENGVHIVGMGEIPDSRIKRILTAAKKAYRLAVKVDADIYHFHDPELLFTGYKLKRKGKKVIFDSHEYTYRNIMDKQYLVSFIRPVASVLYKVFEKSICRKLDAVIYVTPNEKNYFKKLNRHAVMVTNYPVITEKAKEANYTAKNAVFAGNVTEDWNHDKVAKAVNSIEGMKYSLYGPGHAGYLERMKRLPEWKSVDYYGQIPHAGVHERLLEGSVGIALSSPCNNTLGKTGSMGVNKIFEEMMACLPVVCSDFKLWKEFVGKYKCGICVDASDYGQIRDALEYLAEHPGEARQMGLNGRRAVEEEFNWRTQEKKLVKLYRWLET